MSRDPNSQRTGARLGQYPIATSLAIVVALAVVALALLRHLFGSIRVEVGTR